MAATWARAAASAPACRRRSGDIIVTLDGDGQNDPADIPKLLALLRAEPDVGLVSGVRVKRKDTASRRLASRLGNGFRNALLGDGATDTGCGLKAFRRDVFLDLPYFDHMHRFLIALVLREGWKVALCAGEPSPAPDGRVQIHQLRPPAGQRAGSAGRALAAAAPSRPRRDTRSCKWGSWPIWYATLMQHPYDTMWGVFGFAGQAVFGVRFLIQWLKSEQEGHSVIPIAFWYCSLVGGLISFIYATRSRTINSRFVRVADVADDLAPGVGDVGGAVEVVVAEVLDPDAVERADEVHVRRGRRGCSSCHR